MYEKENVEQLVSQAVALDKEQKYCKRKLDTVKAKLQSKGLAMIDDRNVKYIKFYSEDGSVAVGDSYKMDVLRPDKLKDILSEELWMAKDYTFECSLEEFLDEMSVKPDSKQKKLLLKKLKGDYAKDRETLLSVFGYEDDDTAPDFEVELYYIYKIKNGELIRAFLPEECLSQTIEDIKKCLIVESKTSITIDYDNE